jgi:hypothetical protein
VSEYHNAPAATGYSFRFFLTGMTAKPRITILNLHGTAPAPHNIDSGRYPYVVNLYAITVQGNPNPNVEALSGLDTERPGAGTRGATRLISAPNSCFILRLLLGAGVIYWKSDLLSWSVTE